MTAGRFLPSDERFMRLAIGEAQRSLEHEDVPIGADLAVQPGGHLAHHVQPDPSARHLRHPRGRGDAAAKHARQHLVRAQRLHPKKSRSRPAASLSSRPPATSGLWFNCGSASTSSTLPAAPAFGSTVP